MTVSCVRVPGLRSRRAWPGPRRPPRPCWRWMSWRPSASAPGCRSSGRSRSWRRIGLDRAEVADRDRRRRDRRGGGRDARSGRRRGAGGRRGCAGAGTRPGAARWKPTTRPRISSTEVSSPIVETGIFEPSAGSWPDGQGQVVGLEDADDLLAGDARGGQLGRVERDRRPAPRGRRSRRPGRRRRSPRSRGRSRSGRSRRPRSSPSDPVAAIDEMTTGEALMLSAWTVGSADAGRLALAIASVIAGGRRLDVGAERELGDDQRDRVRRGRLDGLEPRHAADRVLDRLGHLLGDVGRAGARVRRDDRDDREVDVRQELLLEAAPGGGPGEEQGRGEQERDAPLAQGQATQATHGRVSDFWCLGWMVGGCGGRGARSMARLGRWPGRGSPWTVRRRPAPRRRGATSRSRSWRWLSSRNRSSRASASGVAVTTTWRRSSASVVPLEQAQLDEPVGQLAGRRRADPEPGGELGHAQPAGGHHDVQDLGLGHRDADLGELRGVAADEPVHHPRRSASTTALDVGRARRVCSRQMECSVTPY